MLIFLLVCMLQHSHAQSPAYSCYGKQQGLVCEEIYDIHQDKLGFIWVASDRGVFRFDGYTFHPFTTAQGLTDNTVFRLSEDYLGRIWLMPFNGALCYIQNDVVTNYEYNDTIAKYMEGLRLIRSLDVHEDGSVEIGFLNYGFVTITSDGKLTMQSPLTNDVARIFVARPGQSGKLLMSNYIGNAIDGSTIIQSGETILQKMNRIPIKVHMSGLTRQNGTTVFCVGNSVYETDPEGKSLITDLPYSVLSVMEDSKHCLWLCTEEGLLKYSANALVTGQQFEHFYPKQIITSIIEDTEGSFWVATHHSGLLYLPNVSIRAWSFFEDDKACDLLPDTTGRMYVLWRDHGITSIYDDSSVVYGPQLDGRFYNVIAWNENHNALLIGTTREAYEFDPELQTCRQIFSGAVNSIAWSQGKIFIGQSWNLCSIYKNERKFIFGNSRVRHRPDVLLRDHEGTIWVGALDGVYKVVDTVMQSVSQMHELFTHRIAGMCELPDSTIVIATQSNGIAFMRGEHIQTLTQEDGFLCDHVYGIIAGNGNTVWCSTQEGVYGIHVSDSGIEFSEQTIVKTILGDGGKPGFIPSLNQLWVCDGNRVVAFDPDATEKSEYVPPVYITSVSIGDSLYNVSDTLQLNYNENSLKITYCGIAYRMHGNVKYRYRLRGSADEWQVTKQNTVQLAGLSDGEYTFEVQAQNETGNWSLVPAIFSFTIIPPFWGTWWFLTGCIVLGALLMYITIVLRFRMVRRRDLLREQALIFRQQALASQMNPHFVFNTLNTIQALVLKEDKTKALDMFSAFASLLRKSLQTSTERLIPLDEELKILKLYFELEEMRFEGNLNYQILLGKNIDVENLNVPAMLIQPLVENALVHGIRKKEGGGSVIIRFELKNGKLFCEVEDDGIGRAASAQAKKNHSSAGTRITRDRLRVLGQMNKDNYSFEIIDKVNPKNGEATGTLVKLTLPFTLSKESIYEKAESTVS